MKPTVFVNGKITSAADAVVPVFDHGFLYGEGVYETMRTLGGKMFMFPRHMARLRRSADLLGLPVPFDDAGLLARVHDVLAAARETDSVDAYVRLLVTRGIGELSYNPTACPTPSLIIIVKALPIQPERAFTDGIALSLVSIRRNHQNALNPMIKSNNLLNNALAMQEALRAGADEALMLNHDGHVVECAQSNFFIVKHGVVMTAPVTDGLLPGVTRGFVLELAAELGIASDETHLGPDDVFSADEAFITGTTRSITPVVSVDRRQIGSGKPGPATRRLLERFRERAPAFVESLPQDTHGPPAS